jgi:hypothetical protein
VSLCGPTCCRSGQKELFFVVAVMWLARSFFCLLIHPLFIVHISLSACVCARTRVCVYVGLSHTLLLRMPHMQIFCFSLSCVFLLSLSLSLVRACAGALVRSMSVCLHLNCLIYCRLYTSTRCRVAIEFK